MTTLGPIELDQLGATLRQRGLDGWLVYDFHELNPIARRALSVSGMLTRRLFLWMPAVGPPRLLIHRIDLTVVTDFPGELDVYTTWEDLHHRLAGLVRGRRIAMEMSPENAVPYLDLVPAGVVELLTRLGASLVPSAPLVTQFTARWSAAEIADHRQAAEAIAAIARNTVGQVVREVGTVTELDVRGRVVEALSAAGLEWSEPPIVAFGANAANPHYEPRAHTERKLEAGDVVLLDLWARRSPNTVWADQTWMGFAGGEPSDEVARVWEAVRDARDAVVERLRVSSRSGERLTGTDLDATARTLVAGRGYGNAFIHRTGHSITLDLHGWGPHLDDFETHDTREFLVGTGFSVEPGVYLQGRFGVRSEINVVLGAEGPLVTPAAPQTELIV
ncbi:MAG: M24 family metallopeptidase [Gemmatimonadales bacterium]|nr:M24 family metallopeptidase [Gemmatimonadales bacterium]NIN12840.1 M24 family metallopeptidase [Gemmatimonadales bacterium]NIN51018.1 M24 family metallopeptidase [Gemmatimonadales bacterium]NIP08482.1 M24 family metallopeptidase [Gemmatimonadales bacterium]NIR02522.1 M24 family metallopeptidase [Gemmatimonadales bacterium]